MDLLSSLLALMTPIGLALFALIITREGQKDRAAENARRDARDEADRAQRAKDNQQSMLLFATIIGKQEAGTAAVTAAVEKSGTITIASVEGAREDIVEGLKEYKRFNIIILDMLLEDPPAGRNRIKRAMKAFAEGDVQGAQAVANEIPAATKTDDSRQAGAGEETEGSIAA